MESMAVVTLALILFMALYFLSIKYVSFAIDISKEIIFFTGSVILILLYTNTEIPPVIFPMYLFSISNKFNHPKLKYLFIPAIILPFAEYYFYLFSVYNNYILTLNYITCTPLAIVIISNIQTQFRKDMTTYLFIMCSFLISGYWNITGHYLALATVGLYACCRIMAHVVQIGGDRIQKSLDEIHEACENEVQL